MTEKTRLVLVTSHVFGIRAYEGMFSSGAYLDGLIDVPLMIGLPPERASATVGYESVSGLARDQGIDFVLADDGTLSSLETSIKNCRPHYILVVGWSRLISSDVLAIPKIVHSADATEVGRHGCIGMHPTKLPTGRGQAPIPWTIIKGLRSTALTVFFLEPEADTGPIIAQYDLPVHERESSASLFYRMASMHFDAGMELAGHLACRQVESRVQVSDQATRWPKRRPSDGKIDHSMHYAEIKGLVRGLLGPYPRAFVSIGGREYAVEDARLVEDSCDVEGTTREDVSTDVIRFGCRDGIVNLKRYRHDDDRLDTLEPVLHDGGELVHAGHGEVAQLDGRSVWPASSSKHAHLQVESLEDLPARLKERTGG
ncbi:formyltransferase family protein [Dactylosporangium sp. NPDC048998]|uniref:formyltransferase family protein n=1 Tax=Dactylosporangium sp. NPDC048998 TaxID=3363976 RepID=UPI003715B55D